MKHNLTFLLLILATGGYSLPAAAETDGDYENRIIETIESIQQAKIDTSLDSLEQLLIRYPNSKLGYLLLGDLLAMRAGKTELLHVTDFGAESSVESADDQLSGLRDEITYRWQTNRSDSPGLRGLIPANLIRTAPNQRYILTVDSSRSRLYVFENSGLSYQLVDDYFITVGKQGMGKHTEGDLKTPLGVYFVTSYLPGDTLPPRYGPGAFPINYPNEFDRTNNRTGYGIWIHGTEPENYNRVPLASDGCVSLSNDEFLDIANYISTDGTTPVIISSEIDWIKPDQLSRRHQEFTGLLEQWQRDWESLDPSRFLSHYSAQDFKSNNLEFPDWSKHKAIHINSSSFIKVGLENVSIFSYPGEDMVVISFEQEFNSNRHREISHKRQYWRQYEDGKWKIINESEGQNVDPIEQW